MGMGAKRGDAILFGHRTPPREQAEGLVPGGARGGGGSQGRHPGAGGGGRVTPRHKHLLRWGGSWCSTGVRCEHMRGCHTRGKWCMFREEGGGGHPRQSPPVLRCSNGRGAGGPGDPKYRPPSDQHTYVCSTWPGGNGMARLLSLASCAAPLSGPWQRSVIQCPRCQDRMPVWSGGWTRAGLKEGVGGGGSGTQKWPD